MPKVEGPLKTVLSNPTQVTGVWVRSGQDRTDGTGMILDEPDKATLSAGVVSFTASPGPAVLVLERAGGRPTTLKLMVGTADSSLADAVNAGSVANHLDSHRLAQLVGMIEATQKNAADAAAAATRAETARNQAESMVETKLNPLKALFPTATLKVGQGLKWDGAKFIPSWMDQHPTSYHNIY